MTEINLKDYLEESGQFSFVGRQNEFDYLQEFLSSSNASGLLLAGEAGVGKTTLLQFFSEAISRDGNWVHFLSLYSSRGTTDVGRLLFEGLLSGKNIIGRDTNSWKELLLSKSSINEYLINYPENLATNLEIKKIIDLITEQIPETKKLIVIFDEIEYSQNIQKTILFFDYLLKLVSQNPKVKFIFSGRPLSNILRLTRSHNLLTLNLKGFSLNLTKELLLNSFSGMLSGNENLESLIIEIQKVTGGSPFLTSLLIEGIQQQGIEGIDYLLKNLSKYSSLSISRSIDLTFKRIVQENKDVLAFLKALVILGGNATPETLMELLDKNRIEISNLVSQVKEFSFVKTGKNGDLFFVHTIIQEYIIQNYIFSDKFDLKILDFGAEEAERDDLLEKNFVFSNSFYEILSGKKSIILGDRGTGKSSIFRFVSDVNNFPVPASRQEQYLSLSEKTLIVPCDDPISILQDNSFFNDNDSAPEKFKMFWLLYIALLSGIAIYKNGDYVNPQNQKDLSDILKKAGLSNEIEGADTSLFKPILNLITKVGSKVSFSIAGIPITLEPSADLVSKKTNDSIDISKLLELSNIIAGNIDRQVIILIDKIDETFKYQRQKQEMFIQGLFLAISHLTKYPNLTITIFLRTDIFRVYDIQEKNKFISRSLTLSWNQQDILQLLVKRLGANKVFQGIQPFVQSEKNISESKLRLLLMLVFPEQMEGFPFVDWLFMMIKNGNNQISPRQIILLLVILKDTTINSSMSGKQIPIFNDIDVKQAVYRLSELSYDEVISDFRVSRTLIQNCRAGKISEFSLEEVQGLFSEEEGTIASQIDIMEKLGILERVVKNDSEKGFISKFRFPDLYTRCWYSQEGF